MKTRAHLSITFAVITASLASAEISVWSPRSHNPQFVTPGGAFVVEVDGAAGLEANGWTASVHNELRSWGCTVTSATYAGIHHGVRNGWRVEVRTPNDMPVGLFGIRLAHGAAATSESPRALSVVERFDEDFYIIQFTDQHITTVAALYADGTSHPSHGNGSTRAMGWAAAAVNLMCPRFVFCTGDNVHNYYSATNWAGMDLASERLRTYKAGLAHFQVPTAATTGNHDIGWSDYVQIAEYRARYEEILGERAFSFKMGSFYVLATEWTSNQYLAWAEADWAASHSDASVLYRLVGSHFYDGLTGWVTVPGSADPCDLMIAGHNHATRKLQTSPYVVLTAASALDHQKAAFFEFRTTASGWTCPQAATHAEGTNVFTLVGDWGAPKLSVSWQSANDGSAAHNTATIDNTFSLDFYTGRVTFLMRKGAYSVTNGRVLSSYDYDNGHKTAVVTHVNIRRQTNTVVSIAPASTAVGTSNAYPASAAVARGRPCYDIAGREIGDGAGSPGLRLYTNRAGETRVSHRWRQNAPR